MIARVALVAGVSLLLAGCGGKDDAAPAVSTAASTTTPTPGLDGASTDPTVSASTGTETALLTAVRAAQHEGFDRVVFEFANGVPGADVRYVERPVRADGSGDVVPVAGKAILLVRMTPALDADLSRETAPPTYTGPTRFVPATRAVTELVRTGGFEAVLTWAVGVDGKRPFRVVRLVDPPRLVIDVATT